MGRCAWKIACQCELAVVLLGVGNFGGFGFVILIMGDFIIDT
jgi:hypothetical protein